MRRRLKSIPADIFEKLTKSQQEAIRFYGAVILMMMNRVAARRGREE